MKGRGHRWLLQERVYVWYGSERKRYLSTGTAAPDTNDRGGAGGVGVQRVSVLLTCLRAWLLRVLFFGGLDGWLTFFLTDLKKAEHTNPINTGNQALECCVVGRAYCNQRGREECLNPMNTGHQALVRCYVGRVYCNQGWRDDCSNPMNTGNQALMCCLARKASSS